MIKDVKKLRNAIKIIGELTDMLEKEEKSVLDDFRYVRDMEKIVEDAIEQVTSPRAQQSGIEKKAMDSCLSLMRQSRRDVVRLSRFGKRIHEKLELLAPLLLLEEAANLIKINGVLDAAVKTITSEQSYGFFFVGKGKIRQAIDHKTGLDEVEKNIAQLMKLGIRLLETQIKELKEILAYLKINYEKQFATLEGEARFELNLPDGDFVVDTSFIVKLKEFMASKKLITLNFNPKARLMAPPSVFRELRRKNKTGDRLMTEGDIAWWEKKCMILELRPTSYEENKIIKMWKEETTKGRRDAGRVISDEYFKESADFDIALIAMRKKSLTVLSNDSDLLQMARQIHVPARAFVNGRLQAA